MTDDPCDPLPETHSTWLHGLVMLDRTADPVTRNSIKQSMKTSYGRLGKSMMPPELMNDPHDPWVLPRWITQATDRRTRPMHMTENQHVKAWDLSGSPPRTLGMFNCRGEYVIKPNKEPSS